LDKTLLKNRKVIIEQAKRNHPERWNGRKTRNLTPIEDVYFNPITIKNGSIKSSTLEKNT
jgi:hypothetical protein